EAEALRHVADAPSHRLGILDGVDPHHRDLARGGREEAGEHPDGGGLAGSVGTEEPEDLATFHGEVERLHGHEVAEALVQGARDDGSGHGTESAASRSATTTGSPGLKRVSPPSIATRTPKRRSARSSSVRAVRVTYSACGLIEVTRPVPAPVARPR